MISPFFTTIVLTSIFIWLFMKFTTKNLNNKTDEFIERERQANSTRKKPLDDLEYINVDIADFTFTDIEQNEQLSEYQKRLEQLSTQKIVNLTGITNTDLKLTYGVANLNLLMEYDQNFTSLCRTVYDFGNALNNMGYIDYAIKVLESGISYKTDISANYTLLAELYINTNQSEKIKSLIEAADSIKSLTKNSTIAKLTKILGEHSNIIVNTEDGVVSSIPTVSNGDNILPEDILGILGTEPYKSDDQKQ